MTREELRLLAARLVAWQCAGHKGCAACPLAPLKAAGGRCAAAVEALLAPLAFAPRRLAGKGARP